LNRKADECPSAAIHQSAPDREDAYVGPLGAVIEKAFANREERQKCD
jgi:hypothetical protein